MPPPPWSPLSAPGPRTAPPLLFWAGVDSAVPSGTGPCQGEDLNWPPPHWPWSSAPTVGTTDPGGLMGRVGPALRRGSTVGVQALQLSLICNVSSNPGICHVHPEFHWRTNLVGACGPPGLARCLVFPSSKASPAARVRRRPPARGRAVSGGRGLGAALLSVKMAAWVPAGLRGGPSIHWVQAPPQLTGLFPAGYGQDLASFGQGFSDPSQQPPSYGGPSVPGSGGPPAGGSGFGRGQNHNVQGFHPYRR